MLRLPILMAVAIAAILVTSCGGSTTAGHPTAHASTTIAVTEHNFGIDLNMTKVSAGTVALAITNTGPSAHEILAFRTDLAQDKLPLGTDGRVKEDALPKAVDTGTDVAPGTQRQLVVNLPPGRYVLICNLPGHYLAGMHTVLTV